MDARKEWQKPQLLILTRGKPEEVILSACKGDVGSGPDDYQWACRLQDPAVGCDLQGPCTGMLPS